MTVQWLAALRNALLDAWETAIGTSPHVAIFTGSQPADCATASSGTKLADFTLDSDWAAAAASGTKAMQKGTTALGATNSYSTTGLTSGTAGYYRIFAGTSTVCEEQGSVGTSGTDMIIDNTSIASGQTVNITAYTKTAPGA